MDNVSAQLQQLRLHNGGGEGGSVVVLQGEEGVGKTRLLEEIRRVADTIMFRGQVSSSKGDAVHSCKVGILSCNPAAQPLTQLWRTTPNSQATQ